MVYNCIVAKGANGIPNLEFISVNPRTNEDYGTTVSVPVKNANAGDLFIEVCREEVCFFPGVVIENEYYFNNREIVHYKNFSILNEVDYIKSPKILYGHVLYNIPTGLKQALKNYDLPIVLRFPIGVFEVSPSREAIILNTESRILIEEKIKAVNKELEEIKNKETVIYTDDLKKYFKHVRGFNSKYWSFYGHVSNVEEKYYLYNIGDLSTLMNTSSGRKIINTLIYPYFIDARVVNNGKLQPVPASYKKHREAFTLDMLCDILPHSYRTYNAPAYITKFKSNPAKNRYLGNEGRFILLTYQNVSNLQLARHIKKSTGIQEFDKIKQLIVASKIMMYKLYTEISKDYDKIEVPKENKIAPVVDNSRYPIHYGRNGGYDGTIDVRKIKNLTDLKNPLIVYVPDRDSCKMFSRLISNLHIIFVFVSKANKKRLFEEEDVRVIHIKDFITEYRFLIAKAIGNVKISNMYRSNYEFFNGLKRKVSYLKYSVVEERDKIRINRISTIYLTSGYVHVSEDLLKYFEFLGWTDHSSESDLEFLKKVKEKYSFLDVIKNQVGELGKSYLEKIAKSFKIRTSALY